MNSVFVLEQLQQNGKPEKTAKYFLGLSTTAKPETTYSLGKAVAIDGANWNWEAANVDAEYIKRHTELPIRIREIKLSVQRYEVLKWQIGANRKDGG